MKLRHEIKPIELLFSGNKLNCDVEQNGLEFIVACKDRETKRLEMRCTYIVNEIHLQNEQGTTLGFPTLVGSANREGSLRLKLIDCERF